MCWPEERVNLSKATICRLKGDVLELVKYVLLSITTCVEILYIHGDMVVKRHYNVQWSSFFMYNSKLHFATGWVWRRPVAKHTVCLLTLAMLMISVLKSKMRWARLRLFISVTAPASFSPVLIQIGRFHTWFSPSAGGSVPCIQGVEVGCLTHPTFMQENRDHLPSQTCN